MIPLALLLIPFLFASIFFIVMAGSAIYHIYRFNFVTPITTFAMIIFSIGAIIIFGLSIYFFSQVSWVEDISADPAFCCPFDTSSSNTFGL